MKRKGLLSLITVGVILVVLFGIFYLWGISVYNKAVGYQENYQEQWGNVQTAYQRRADLIPNIAATAKASMEQEKELQTEVARLRSGIAKAESAEDLEILGQKISTAINLAFEAYPDVKSTEGYRDLIRSLEGTENRIGVERRKYNNTVKKFNSHIRSFLKRKALAVFAEEDEFVKQTAFKADEGSEEAVDVGEILNN